MAHTISCTGFRVPDWLRQVSIIISSVASWIFFLPFLLLLVLKVALFLMWRSIVDLIVWYRHPDWEPILSPDCVRAVGLQSKPIDAELGEPAKMLTGNGVGGVFVDGAITLEYIRAQCEKNLLKDSKFRRLKQIPHVFMGFAFWGPSGEKFNINYHTAEITSAGGETMEELLERVDSSGLEMGCPLWKLVLISTKTDNGATKTAICLIINHMLGDGFTARQILHKLFGVKLESLTPVPKGYLTMPNLLNVILTKIYHILVFPKSFLYISHWNHVGRFLKDRHVARANDVFSMGKYDLQRIKKIARANKCRFNEVLLLAIFSGIKKYADENPEEIVAKQISCSLAIPWRYSPRTCYFGNKSTILPLLLPLDQELDLKSIHKQAAQLVELGIDRLVYNLAHLGYVLPIPFMRLLNYNTLTASLIVSDFVMAINQTFVNEYPVTGYFSAMNLQVAPNAVGAGIFLSSVDKVDMSLFFSKNFIPDKTTAGKIRDYALAKLDELYMDTTTAATLAGAQDSQSSVV